MRTMITSVLVSVLLGGFTGAAAQLPPDILADSYLLRAEQAVRDGDLTRARTEINKILDLQKEHALDLPDEFHFRYAKAAAAADLPERAFESVVTYLSVAGREGQHYIEALKLMNQVQDEIKGRKGQQVASPGQPLPTQPAIDFGPDSSSSQDGVAAVSCEKWNTEEYFKTAALKEVTTCLDNGADPKAEDRYKYTPLHRAAKYNDNPAVIQALIAAGADPKARNAWEYTPLHGAARFNENPEAIEVLIAAGAELEVRDQWGETPLHSAARNDNPAVVQALIAAGADPKVRNEYKWTPLQYAGPER